MPSPEELAPKTIDAPDFLNSYFILLPFLIVQHLQSAQLDRVSRVCISTIQRLYSMLLQFFFWIETRMPQDEITQADRRRVVRDQGSECGAPRNLFC